MKEFKGTRYVIHLNEEKSGEGINIEISLDDVSLDKEEKIIREIEAFKEKMKRIIFIDSAANQMHDGAEC